MSKMIQLDTNSNNYMNSLNKPLRVDGMTANPPIDVRMGFANRMKKHHLIVILVNMKLIEYKVKLDVMYITSRINI